METTTKVINADLQFMPCHGHWIYGSREAWAIFKLIASFESICLDFCQTQIPIPRFKMHVHWYSCQMATWRMGYWRFEPPKKHVSGFSNNRIWWPESSQMQIATASVFFPMGRTGGHHGHQGKGSHVVPKFGTLVACNYDASCVFRFFKKTTFAGGFKAIFLNLRGGKR